ncbi:MAG: type II toxin-antitoxin system RatA family toxin [Burkholderiales bacterium]|nr:type II toxin-antitoxin system RatA family toxin [Burkholderiales bacterium]
MNTVERSALVPYTAEQMFSLVDDVESYPGFLPWCGATKVRFRDELVTEAEIGVNYRGIRQTFTTRNSKTFPSVMTLRLVDGPFRALDGEWRFSALGTAGCRIDFRLSYEFSGGLLDRLFAPVFKHIAESMMDAFLRRADQLHPSS